MNWYYALNGQQMGPVSDMEFTTLVREGKLTPTSLVWQEGMPQWLPLEQVRPDLFATAATPTVAGVPVAEQNKDIAIQQLREGAVTNSGGTIPSTGLRYAGFWIRVAAKLIDSIIIMIPVILISMLLGVGMAGMSGDIESDPTATAAFGILNLLVTFGSWVLVAFYNGIMVSKWGATLGKLAVGLRVVTEDGQGVGFGKAVGRGFADLLSGMLCNLPYLMVAFDEPQKRALHDHICGTRVVYKS